MRGNPLTGEDVENIRFLRMFFSIRATARIMGVCRFTVEKYQSPEAEAKERNRQQKRVLTPEQRKRKNEADLARYHRKRSKDG